MKIHILGICGTFMAGIAVIARQLGHQVSGSDLNVYPPMSTQLQQQGIQLHEGYLAEHLQPRPDLIIVGNALSRGKAAVEYMLNDNIPYISAPQWLAENVLQHKWVLAVSGTHGKTTTTSLLAWILEFTGLNPSFLVGGVPENFGVSARLTDGQFFVIEADEYDSAFFDKRSKFIHYHPRTLIVNNLEFDHADIFTDLAAIQKQFHHLIRTVPGNGLIIHPVNDQNVLAMLEQGCWTARENFALTNGDWQVSDLAHDGSAFTVNYHGEPVGKVRWNLLGIHNVNNALAAIASAHHAGVPIARACDALSEFRNVKKRLEIKGQVNNITVYDDFAHHPTAIATTIDALRRRVGKQRIFSVLEFSSYTLRHGVMKKELPQAFAQSDFVFLARPQDGGDIDDLAKQITVPCYVEDSVEKIVAKIAELVTAGDHVLVMGKTAFGGIHQKLLERLG